MEIIRVGEILGNELWEKEKQKTREKFKGER